MKGIQIKNFDKILKVNNDKSKSNSSNKSRRLSTKNNKCFDKIPKDSKKINIEKKNKGFNNIKIDKTKLKILKKMKIKNNNISINGCGKSLTERNNLNKYKRSLII